MSLRTLLEPETKVENWSNVYCNSVNSNEFNVDEIVATDISCQNFSADSAGITNLAGRLETSTAVLTPASYTIISANPGTMLAEQSAVSYWIANASNRTYHRIEGSLLLQGTRTNTFDTTASRMNINLDIPYSASILYPSNNGDLLPGSCVTGFVDNGSGNGTLPISGSIARNTANQITLLLCIPGDLTGANAGRLWNISYTVIYRINP